VHAHGGSGRPPVRMPPRLHLFVLACGFLCTSVAALNGFVREMAHSPAAWPVAVAIGASGAVGSIAAWRRLRRIPKRRAITSRRANVLAGVIGLGLFIFLMAIFSQVYGDLMYRAVPISWLADSGVPFHPNRPGLLVDGATAFLLTLLVTLTAATVISLMRPKLGSVGRPQPRTSRVGESGNG
jgi:hypothetical protein